MGRKRSQKAAESEAKISDALSQVVTGKFKSAYQASKELRVSKATLYRRKNGGKTRAQAREAQQNLSIAEERALVSWISMLSATGYPVSPGLAREMAEEIRLRRVESVNEKDCAYVEYPPLGKEWLRQFYGRYPSLKVKLVQVIDSARIKDVTIKAIEEFFEVFTRILEENRVMIKNIYNMDETGWFPIILG
jgi:Tc5 transposase DNA-binding domain